MKLVYYFMSFQNKLKIYHWHTFSYARHKASDALFDDISDQIDKFMESYIGIYSRAKTISNSQLLPALDTLSDKSAVKLLSDFRMFLSKDLPAYVSPKDTDLLTIRDEMMLSVDKALYLFTLK